MQREITLEGCVNFRDVGGYQADGGRVAWRRLFRSDALHELTEADVATLGELDVTTVIDLRSDFERGHDGDRQHPLATLGVNFVHAPIVNEVNGAYLADTGLTLAQRYARIVETAGPALATALTAIAESSGASVFHCAAGKDRSGIMSAVVLGSLGVSDEDVIADYAMTGRNLVAIDARLRNHPAYESAYRHVPQDAMTADAETMSGLIEDLRANHGSMAGLLREIGVPGPVLSGLRVALVTAS